MVTSIRYTGKMGDGDSSADAPSGTTVLYGGEMSEVSPGFQVAAGDSYRCQILIPSPASRSNAGRKTWYNAVIPSRSNS